MTHYEKPDTPMKLSLLESVIAGVSGRIDMRAPALAAKTLARGIRCADGTTLSVQASRAHLCTPCHNAGPYTHVEVGFPSSPPPDSWLKYFDGSEDQFIRDPSGSVYGFVPVDLVREYIEEHGGEV